MRLYVIGAEGQISRSLREVAASHPDVIIGCGVRPEVDILSSALVEKALHNFSPDIVINPAAYTSVDRAEAEPALAFEVNRDGAGIVAEASGRLGIPILHLSTDYVFDGKKGAGYVESDTVSPQSVYGRSKLAGECAVAAANDRHIILRTSWVYAPFGSNFVRTILRLSAERERLSVVDDQIGCPTYAPDVADAILTIARKITASGCRQEYGGVTHLAGPDAITWFSFARKIISVAKKHGGRDIQIDPITTASYPTAAARPANSRLCCERLATLFGIRLPPLDHSLEKCLERLMARSDG